VQAENHDAMSMDPDAEQYFSNSRDRRQHLLQWQVSMSLEVCVSTCPEPNAFFPHDKSDINPSLAAIRYQSGHHWLLIGNHWLGVMTF